MAMNPSKYRAREREASKEMRHIRRDLQRVRKPTTAEITRVEIPPARLGLKTI